MTTEVVDLSGGAFAGVSTDIARIAASFRALSWGRLVILGGPGTGKTTLAVQLVRELVETRERAEPVPVLLSVAGWDTAAFPCLQDWLAARLAADYPVPELDKDTVKELVAARRVFAVLDGLDEVPDATRADVLHALNRSLDRADKLIITSRTAEFVEIGSPLTAATVIEPEPLQPEDAATYLESVLPPATLATGEWRTFLAALRTAPPPGPLTEVCSTPLGLWLVRSVLNDAPADPIRLLQGFSNAVALRRHLFDQLIPVLLAQRPPTTNGADPFRPRRRYDTTRVTRWLGFLAHHLTRVPQAHDGEPSRDIAWWRLPRELRPLSGLLYLMLAAMFGYLGYHVTAQYHVAVEPTHPVPLLSILGVLIGAGIALFIDGGQCKVEPNTWVPTTTQLSPRMLTTTTFMLVQYMSIKLPMMLVIVTLVVAVINGGFPTGFDGETMLGSAALIAAAVTAGMATMRENTLHGVRQTTTPLGNLRRNRRVTEQNLIAGLIAGGMTLGIWGVYGFQPRDVLILALIGMLLGALIFGLTPVSDRSWPAYLAATFRLSARRQLPRDVMAFLEDMHRIGLLRAVGPIYQFRHADLQDHLAGCYRSG